jgi:glutathione S-transferase
MLTLYNTNHSTCSQKTRIALQEKNLEFKDHQISLRDLEQFSDWYMKLNPNGVVPTLVHDDKVIIESTVIGEYVDDAFGGPRLTPDDPYQRARMRVWRQYIDEVPTVAVRVPSFNLYLLPKFLAVNENWLDTRKDKTPLRKAVLRRMNKNGFPKEEMDDARDKLRQTVERMSKSLESGPWLAGEQFTLADINMTPNLVRLEDLGLHSIWAGLPRVTDWYARIQARPSFAKAYYEGSRIVMPKN